MKKKDLNQRQKEFYNSKNKNKATQLWSYFRNGLLTKIRKDLGIEHQIVSLHKTWLGDLANKKVLDLGCYQGNILSVYLAKNSQEYIGIDLSDTGIDVLRKKLKDIPQAKAIAKDFLAEDFLAKDFDIIYAYGVLHHFQDSKKLITKLNQKLNSNGKIISYDPLETSLPVKLVRKIYRPFQSDKDWEWPFTKNTYLEYANAFEIKERRAVLGKAKWSFLLNLMPISREKKDRIGKKWHQEDWEQSRRSDADMFECMHITMLMQKRD